jgi:hypothetical protein
MSPAEVHNLSNDIMTPFAMETMTEDEILKNRMAIIDNLFDRFGGNGTAYRNRWLRNGEFRNGKF